MTKYINSDNSFLPSYDNNITYNFDNVQFKENSINSDDTLTINISPEDSTTTNNIDYTIIKHYINTLDLTKINTINLKITNTYTQTDDYLITDMYITKITNTSLGVLNNDDENTKFIYTYSIILRFAPLTKNEINTDKNIYIIRPLLYTNENTDTVTPSKNILLNVQEIMDNPSTSDTTDYIISVATPEIIITNINSIDELINRSDIVYYIDATNKIILFKTPLSIGANISSNYSADVVKSLPTPTIMNTLVTTPFVDDEENQILKNVTYGIIKNNAIGQTSTDLDSNIYINCHPIDNTGRIIPKSDNSKKTNTDIKISIIFFGVFFTICLGVYVWLYRINELYKLFNTGDMTEDMTSIRMKYGVMLFVFITCWVFIGINIDNMPD